MRLSPRAPLRTRRGAAGLQRCGRAAVEGDREGAQCFEVVRCVGEELPAGNVRLIEHADDHGLHGLACGQGEIALHDRRWAVGDGEVEGRAKLRPGARGGQTLRLALGEFGDRLRIELLVQAGRVCAEEQQKAELIFPGGHAGERHGDAFGFSSGSGVAGEAGFKGGTDHGARIDEVAGVAVGEVQRVVAVGGHAARCGCGAVWCWRGLRGGEGERGEQERGRQETHAAMVAAWNKGWLAGGYAGGMAVSEQNRARVIAAFVAVYLCWGSTYTAIHVAGEHLPPPVVSATRSILTTTLIVLIALLMRKSLRVPKGEGPKLALVGLLFMSGNNMLLTWGETMLPSGFASLVVSTMPMMIAVMEWMLPGGEPLNKRGWAGTLLGTVGISVLVWPSLHRGAGGAQAAGHTGLGVVICLLAALCFGVGSILSRRFHFKADTFIATGWQIGAAGLFNTLFALVTGGFHRAVWTVHGMESIVWLSVMGSMVGLVAFTYLLQNVAVSKVATYAFVNPMIAVLLGVVLLHERLEPTEITGMAVIVASVALVVLSRVGPKRGEVLDREIVAVSGEAVE